MLLVPLALIAACGDDDDPKPSSTPGASVVTEAPTPERSGAAQLYLAMGDSLSEGIAASDPARTAWVPLVAARLGDGYELLNLGVAGHDSQELMDEGPLDQAIVEIASRADDDVKGNEVGVITLEIGGNDLLDLYFDFVLTGICPTVEEGLENPLCVRELQAALAGFDPNLGETLDILRAEAPGVPIFVMTLYNPFSGGSFNLEQIGILALEGEPGTVFEEGLNDLVRKQVDGREDVHLVEWYEPFLGKQGEYISLDFIHPNDTGYRVMADEVLAAMEDAGVQ